MQILPTQSALLHMRFFFSFFLLPVYVFALSQAPQVSSGNAFIVFVCWHLLIYPASNGYNSYFDKDEGSIALLEKPPEVDKSLYRFSLLLDLLGFLLALVVSLEFALATLTYGLLSKMYSHPLVRLKKYPWVSFFVVFLFQGAFVYWTTLAAISRESVIALWNTQVFVAGLVCSCLIGATYPLTQVYQHAEDAKRGDKTLSLLLGVKGSFVFSAVVFIVGIFLMFFYWKMKDQLSMFFLFLLFLVPVVCIFLSWMFSAFKSKSEASFKSMSRMTMVSGIAMLAYFLTVWVLQMLK